MAENAFVPETDTFAVAILGPGTNITSSFLTATTFATMDAIEATQGYLYRLSLSASGTISQLTVNGADVTVKAGQILRLVHPITLQSEEVTVTADKVGNTVFIDTVTLEGSYPPGAYVYVSAQSQQAGIIVGENAVRIYAEGQSLGRLATAIDGLVTSINAHLYTKLVQGMEFLVINEQTGRTYAFTVDQATAGPGVVTFDVEAQLATARVGDYLVGDNSFQQSQITVSQGEIVLKVDSNNRVALVRLSADNDSGSEIDISAEQVKINGIIFTEGADPIYTPGDIATSNYSAGVAGWKIDGDGSAEFNSVTVRGSLEASTIDGNLTMDGGSITNTAGTYVIDEDGITLDGSTYNQSGSAIVWDDGVSTTYGVVAGGDISGVPVMAINGNASGYIRLSVGTVDPDEEQIKIYASYVQIGLGNEFRSLDETDSTSTTTGSIITAGGVGIAKNLHVGGTVVAPIEAVKFIEGADSPYGVLANDVTLLVDTSASAVTLNLPAGTTGRRITVKHIAGTASTEPITINRASTDTIEGNTSYTINTDKGCVSLVFYSGVWYILSEII
jgi:hypothetical protein